MLQHQPQSAVTKLIPTGTSGCGRKRRQAPVYTQCVTCHYSAHLLQKRGVLLLERLALCPLGLLFRSQYLGRAIAVVVAHSGLCCCHCSALHSCCCCKRALLCSWTLRWPRDFARGQHAGDNAAGHNNLNLGWVQDFDAAADTARSTGGLRASWAASSHGVHVSVIFFVFLCCFCTTRPRLDRRDGDLPSNVSGHGRCS
jgi:hypothetical protein